MRIGFAAFANLHHLNSFVDLYYECMNILGVRIDNLSRKEILEKIESFLDEAKFHQVCTVNAEFILEAQENEEFKQILNSSVLNVADAMSIKFAFWKYGRNLKARIAGADLMHEILKMANKRKFSVFLAANKGGLSTWEETAEVLRRIYPSVTFNGANIDISKPYNPEPRTCNLIFCSFGTPQQELFINSVKNDTIRLAMGIGGAFDFVTGKVKRAPKIWRKLGMEWLWRFLQEPRYRAKRIFRAVIIFPIKILLKK